MKSGLVTSFSLPKELGVFNVRADEVMYYLYLPVSRPGDNAMSLPDQRLNFILPLLRRIFEDEPTRCEREWVYVTIKKMYVGGGVTPNRPGWHCDGFLSDDLNYVWADCIPTVFTKGKFEVSPDHVESLRQFDEQAEAQADLNIVYPDCTLLKLDSTVVHRVNTEHTAQTMRTFVKVTISKNRFNLADNSRNTMLPDDGPRYERALVRNDPYQAQSDTYKPNPKDDHFA